MKERASIAAGTDYVDSHPIAQLLNAGGHAIHFSGINSDSAVPPCDPHLLSVVFYYNPKEVIADRIHSGLLALCAQANELLQHILPFVKAMFLALQHDWIKAHHLWCVHLSQLAARKKLQKFHSCGRWPSI